MLNSCPARAPYFRAMGVLLSNRGLVSRHIGVGTDEKSDANPVSLKFQLRERHKRPFPQGQLGIFLIVHRKAPNL